MGRKGTKTVKSEKPSYGKGVFKVTLTAVYKDDSMDAESISDDLFKAMSKTGGLALMHVDSVRKVSKPEEAIAKILEGISGQAQDAMSDRTTEDGKKFIAVDGKDGK